MFALVANILHVGFTRGELRLLHRLLKNQIVRLLTAHQVATAKCLDAELWENPACGKAGITVARADL
jgi:hypothetical protein